jgi:hypothetical protein
MAQLGSSVPGERCATPGFAIKRLRRTEGPNASQIT